MAVSLLLAERDVVFVREELPLPRSLPGLDV